MAQLPECPIGVNCPGTDFPVANFSSEADDGPMFLSMSWPGGGGGTPTSWSDPNPIGGIGGGGFPGKGGGGGGIWPNPPRIGGGPSANDKPPLGSDWFSEGCYANCFSFISQELADVCAVLQAQLCQSPDVNTAEFTGPTMNGQPIHRYLNEQQTCLWTCGDGSTTAFTVAAGQVSGASLDLANRIASSIACNMAYHNRLCLNSIDESACVGVLTAFEIRVTEGEHPPYSFEVVGGQLPPGMDLEFSDFFSVYVSGTPTQSGTYDFIIQCTSDNGQVVTKSCRIGVAGIQSASLPDGVEGTPYSATIAMDGPGGPFTYELMTENIFDGLTLHSDGTVDGTPILSGSQTVPVRVTNSQGFSCTQDVSITITPAPSACTCANVNLPDPPLFEVGVPYTTTIVPNCPAGPYTFSVPAAGNPGALPDGLVIDPNTGVITGTPTVFADYVSVINVINASVPDSCDYIANFSPVPVTYEFYTFLFSPTHANPTNPGWPNNSDCTQCDYFFGAPGHFNTQAHAQTFPDCLFDQEYVTINSNASMVMHVFAPLTMRVQMTFSFDGYTADPGNAQLTLDVFGVGTYTVNQGNPNIDTTVGVAAGDYFLTIAYDSGHGHGNVLPAQPPRGCVVTMDISFS